MKNIKFVLENPKKLGSLTYDSCITKTHIIRLLMQLYDSMNIHVLY